jgi:biopolymer transport protein ExbD
MKFPRNSKLLRSPFDAAPFAGVFFLLVIFVMLGALVPSPGLRLKLQPPTAANLPGINQPTVAMAVDADGRYYFKNQQKTREELRAALQTEAQSRREPLTLLIHADKHVSFDGLVEITLLARDAGITNAFLATLPAEDDRPAGKR